MSVTDSLNCIVREDSLDTKIFNLEEKCDKLTLIIQELQDQINYKIDEQLEEIKRNMDITIKSAAEAEKSAEAAFLSEMLSAVSAQDSYNNASSINALAAPVWDSMSIYNYPDVVCYEDGNSYRCIGYEVSGNIPPINKDWIKITFSGDAAQNLDNLIAANRVIKRNFFYDKKEIVFSPYIPSWACLECCSSGITGSGEPDYSDIENTDVIDGGVIWKLRKVF